MTEPTPDETLALRRAAAIAGGKLLDAARRGSDDEIRMMMMSVCARLGHSNVLDLADDAPQEVIHLWEAVELLEEQSFDNVQRRASEASS